MCNFVKKGFGTGVSLRILIFDNTLFEESPSKTLVPVFLYPNNQIKVNSLSCFKRSSHVLTHGHHNGHRTVITRSPHGHHNGSSVNKFSVATQPHFPLPVLALLLKVGRKYQSRWWMLTWRIFSTKQSQMTNNNILYTHPFVILKVIYFL